MKKVLFAILVLMIGLWSCSQNEGNENVSDGYVDVTIGTESGRLKSYVAPGGITSWNIYDTVVMLCPDGDLQKFYYMEETAKSSALFKGMLKTGQGKQVYKPFHAPTRSHTRLKDGHILVTTREDIVLDEQGEDYNSTVFGSYCPMVAIPLRFDANNSDDSKSFQFYHLSNMILAKVSLRPNADQEILSQTFDNIKFEVQAKGSKPFYSTIELDMNMLTTDSKLEDLDEYIINLNDTSVKTDHMYTIMNFKERGDNFTIEDLLKEYSSLGSFPIPIIALPTEDSFNYIASVSFCKGEVVKVKFQGEGTASGLSPAGLNNLNFDYKKLVTE
jgi:hypothetical protein